MPGPSSCPDTPCVGRIPDLYLHLLSVFTVPRRGTDGQAGGEEGRLSAIFFLKRIVLQIILTVMGLVPYPATSMGLFRDQDSPGRACMAQRTGPKRSGGLLAHGWGKFLITGNGGVELQDVLPFELLRRRWLA